MPDVKVVVLTASEDDDDLFAAVESGAQGEPVFTPHLARTVLDTLTDQEPDRQAAEALTAREREVLDLLVQGVTSNRELAARLVVSANTVKFHLHNILYKVHARNRAQAVAFALRHNLADQLGGPS